MGRMEIDARKSAEPDCFIVSVGKKTIPQPAAVTEASSSSSSTPRRSQNYLDAQAASSSQQSAAHRASRALRSSSGRAETPRKRGRSRSPSGTPPSTNKRSRALSEVGSTLPGSPLNYYDAESNQGEGGEDESATGDRYIFSPHGASPPVPSRSSATSSFLSDPIPFPLRKNLSSQRLGSSASSSSTASPSPSQQGPTAKAIIKIEEVFHSPPSSFPPSSQSSSSSQSLPRIVRNPSWNFEIDMEGVFTCVYDHWAASIPAVLPKLGPRCKKCDRLSKLNIAGKNNKAGNAGRPFYKCSCSEWVTWGDLEGCDLDNVDCYCGKGKRVRTDVCKNGSRYPGRKFYKCANGACKYWEYELDWEWEARRQVSEAEVREAADVPLPEGDDW
ncbi:hypothetical protein QBC42DRAFT_21856 [Cladorrhinum samala]|uniref:GRF-like zinc ribbon domain-containing protein n=1 Tax=Cladorrhinum samala TaxID=585594 RepID=A0AAV9HXV7_9PEZI|nr:hypothetical protein QBC42DRAFT_21856 [Cladorrhinum samala]